MAKINTGFGCRKGGWLDCPKPSKLFCNDGTLLDNSYIMKWRTKTADERRRLGDNFNGCICSDGIMPRFAVLIFSHELSAKVSKIK